MAGRLVTTVARRSLLQQRQREVVRHSHALALPDERFQRYNSPAPKDVDYTKSDGQVHEVLLDHLHATAFQYTPSRRTFLGSKHNIRSISKANLKDYVNKHYTGPRMVFGAAGAVNHDELVKEVEKSFKNLSTDPISAADLVEKEPTFCTGSEMLTHGRRLPLADTFRSCKEWKVVHRPLLEMDLHRYAQSPVVPQPLILHGPRGVGKRTVVEGLLEEWSREPHSAAYVDLYAHAGAAAASTEGKYTTPWTLSPSCPTVGVTDLQWVRRKLEQALESLAIQAVQAGCLKSKNVFDVLIDRHTVDGALSEFLQSQAIPGVSGDTKQLWQHALLYMKRASGVSGQPIRDREITRIDEVLLAVLNKSDTDPINNVLSHGVGRKNAKNAGTQLDVKEKALLSLALTKYLLQIQENWKVTAGADRKRQGFIPKGLVDAAVSWPALLLELVSWSTSEGVFQPKLVINGFEVSRNASTVIGGMDGSSYHDAFLLQLVNINLSQGSFPVILVSSDSYYSWQLDDDFGNSDAFISIEAFGWTPKEAALHVVPGVFTADEWKVVSAVLGSNPRHSVELLHLRHSEAFSERLKTDDSLDIEDCIDLYLAYLQVTAVDPAIDAALGLLEQFADKARKGAIDSNRLQHGAPWRDFPRNDSKERRQQWARIQLMDFIQAFTDTEFGVNYLGGDLELLDDPAARALLQVGLLYQQRAPPLLRPTSRGILRCLTRWFVREKLHLERLENLRLKWHRLMRGRSYRHLMRE